MVRFFLLLILISAIASCAEVVPLTGGPEDKTAPRIVNQEPDQAITNFNGNEVTVEFDEYIKLNDPKNTITINPATVKVNTELEKRTLRIFWDGSLDQNTTYIIQLNGTVRDINEANDSIMQLVFSTGPVIDSLSLKGKIVGSFSNTVESQMTVALFNPDSNALKTKPVYATRTDARGNFTFSYLKPGNYQLFAFSDANKDRRVQADESVAFMSGSVQAGDTNEILMRSFPRIAPKKTLRVDVLAPGTAKVYNLDKLDPKKVVINNQPAELLQLYSPDSALFAIPPGTGNFVFSYDTLKINKTLNALERNAAIRIDRENKTGKWLRGDSLVFIVNDLITETDQVRIRLNVSEPDSSDFQLLRNGKNQLIVVPNAAISKPFGVSFEKGAVSGQTSASDSVTFTFTPLLKADLGNLRINCKGFEGQWIMELTQNDKVVYSKIKPSGDSTVYFPQIISGIYSLRCTKDENMNGKWDTGNPENKQQPEIVKRFTLKQKIRPGWDVEETVIEEQ